MIGHYKFSVLFDIVTSTLWAIFGRHLGYSVVK